MNVINDKFKYRQLHSEDYLQIVLRESKEYAEVSAGQRIAESNHIITDFQTDGLLKKILQPTNLNNASSKEVIAIKFDEKLVKLRKAKTLFQEELADYLINDDKVVFENVFKLKQD